MAYRFATSDETIAAGVRRIACTQLDAALAILTSGDAALPPSIHRIRKDIKKLRGLIRIVKPGLHGFQKKNASLRDAARSLGALRDSDVLIETLNFLNKEKTDFPNLREILSAGGRANIEPTLASTLLAGCSATLAGMRVRAPDWTITGDAFHTPRSGLKLTYRAAQRAMQQVHDEPTDDHVHAWRKRVKDSHYQMLLIEPFWPQMITPRVKATDILGELLGTHHDLSVLGIHAGAVPIPAEESNLIKTRVRAEQDKILHKAIPLGARLFAGNAVAMSDLWSDWWKIWRESS